MYKVLDTNKTDNRNILKIEVLFDLDGKSYKIHDENHVKNIVCVCGSCELYIAQQDKQKRITLDNIANKIQINKGVSVELRNYTDDVKVAVEYVG